MAGGTYPSWADTACGANHNVVCYVEPAKQCYIHQDMEQQKSGFIDGNREKLGGGPLTQDLRSHPSVDRIESPLASLIANANTYGLYHIHRLRDSSSHSKNKYYDI